MDRRTQSQTGRQSKSNSKHFCKTLDEPRGHCGLVKGRQSAGVWIRETRELMLTAELWCGVGEGIRQRERHNTENEQCKL